MAGPKRVRLFCHLSIHAAQSTKTMKNWILVLGPIVALITGVLLYLLGESNDIAWTAGVALRVLVDL